MDFSLIEQLQKAGFPNMDISGFIPTLEELIDACGENFGTLSQHVERSLWEATSKVEKDKPAVRGIGASPRDAVASMWLAWINGINRP